jgi:glycosyltransferase involved in cell wall biosynthesis
MSKDTRFSVVIPCYNASPFLGETLQSVMNQSYLPLEVLLVDDGSTDDSSAIAESFGSPVRVIHQANQGESVARNRGVDEAKGDWVCFLDADDVWEPAKLSTCHDAVTSLSQDIVCIYNDHYRFGRNVTRSLCVRPEYHDFPNPIVEMLCDWCVQPSTAMVRTDVAKRVRFPEETRHSEDVIFFANVRAFGGFLRIPKALTGYRQSSNQQTQSPQHMQYSIQARFAWATRNPEIVDSTDLEILRERMEMSLMLIHERAYWNRNWEHVRSIRSLYEEIIPAKNAPPEMRRALWPASLLRIKDWIDEILSPCSRTFGQTKS